MAWRPEEAIEGKSDSGCEELTLQYCLMHACYVVYSAGMLGGRSAHRGGTVQHIPRDCQLRLTKVLVEPDIWLKFQTRSIVVGEVASVENTLDAAPTTSDNVCTAENISIGDAGDNVGTAENTSTGDNIQEPDIMQEPKNSPLVSILPGGGGLQETAAQDLAPSCTSKVGEVGVAKGWKEGKNFKRVHVLGDFLEGGCGREAFPLEVGVKSEEVSCVVLTAA